MEAPLWEGQVAYTLSHALPEGCALHVAGSMPIRDLDTFGGCQNRDIAVYANRGANGIDGTLATAAGESLQQHKPLCVLLGDLAFIHDISGLLTASQLGAQLTIVVVDNGGGAIFENLVISQHPTAFERYFLTPQKADIERLASACGARVSRASTHRELRAAVQADLERSGLGVVLVSVDREYNRQQHQNAWTEVQRAMDQGGLQ
jgi:2-succinyl-5-enolpyruvyl-6-hydroxy-3-cyclohexene-1-carboxylate synthase